MRPGGRGLEPRAVRFAPPPGVEEDSPLEDLARRLGKSRTSVTESLALNAMPGEVRNLCRLADISAKSLLLQVVRQNTPEKMTALIEKIASQGGGATRQQLREAVHARGGGQDRRSSGSRS